MEFADECSKVQRNDLKKKKFNPYAYQVGVFCIHAPFIVIPVLAFQSMQWHPFQLASLLILILISLHL